MVAMKKPSRSSSDSPITDMEETPPVLTAGQKRSRKGGAKNGEGVARDRQSEHEMHIYTERERRKKMRNMFSNLHSLLPQLPPKADKSTIVDEAVRYIKTLEKSLQTLENQKLEKFGSRMPSILDNEKSILTTSDPPFPSAPETQRETFLADQVAASMTTPRATLPEPFPSLVCFQTWFSPNVVINTCGNEAQISICSPQRPGLLTTIIYILQKHNLEVLSTHVNSNQFRTMYMIHAQAVGGKCSDQVSGGHVLSVEETFKLAAGEMNLWLLTCA